MEGRRVTVGGRRNTLQVHHLVSSRHYVWSACFQGTVFVGNSKTSCGFTPDFHRQLETMYGPNSPSPHARAGARPRLTYHVVNVSQQPDSVSCGVYSVATLSLIALHGGDPRVAATWSFEVGRILAWFRQCLQKPAEFGRPPTTKSKRLRAIFRHTLQL